VAFALRSRPERQAAVSAAQVRNRTAARGQRAIDSKPGFERSDTRPRAASRLLAPLIQAKLEIGEPSDKFEQEADRVAERIMRMAEPKPANESGRPEPSIGPGIQRLCPECDEELHRQPIDEEGERDTLPAKETTDPTPSEVTSDLESGIQSLRAGGRPLATSVRAFFEPRYGVDFGVVRIHADTRSSELARSLNARAFTVGQDVVFGAGQYSPETSSGKRLLAHELTHTIQQRPHTLAGGIAPEGVIRRQEITSAPPSTCGDAQSCSAGRCSEMRPALREAQSLVGRAHRDLAPGETGGTLPERTGTALHWHFRTMARDDIRQIRENLLRIEDRLNEGLDIFTCNDPGNHCRVLGFIPAVLAYTYRGRHPITLCPILFSLHGTRSQAVTMIHEAGHNIGLPRSPLEREVYEQGHEYRALSTEEALVTTDAYASFAHDNRYGASVSVSFTGLELGTGLAFTGGQPQFALTFGWSAEFAHPALRIVSFTSGIEFALIPATGERSERFLASAALGTRIGARGQRTYLDLRAGGFIGEAGPSQLAGVLTEASAHFQPNQFDISLFWRNYHSLIEGTEDTTIIGVAGQLPF
jgi:hypothetical protein